MPADYIAFQLVDRDIIYIWTLLLTITCILIFLRYLVSKVPAGSVNKSRGDHILLMVSYIFCNFVDYAS